MGSFSLWKTADETFPTIRNIFCVGRNYREHAAELGNAVPEKPMIFGKFTHSLVCASQTVAMPPSRDVLHHELEIVLYIDKPVTRSSRAMDVVGAVALGLDLTDRAAQNVLKEKGHPWEFAKSFVRSAIVSDFYHTDSFADVERSKFELTVNERLVQTGTPSDMVFDFDTLVQYCHLHYGLNAGDILYTGTPPGVGPIKAGDRLVMTWNGETVASFSMGQASREEDMA